MALSTSNRLPPELLLSAYANGYFPMPEEKTNEILWYRPDPRAIFPLDGFYVSRSLHRCLRRGEFRATFDEAFADVMLGCAERKETWITEEFKDAYGELHRLGFAHSVEVWAGTDLVGGVYGVSIGGAFFAESKFHRKTDASKVALYFLIERLKEKGFSLLEVQFMTEHLASLGALEIPETDYLLRLRNALALPAKF